MPEVRAGSWESKWYTWGYIIAGIILTPAIVGIPLLIMGLINLYKSESAKSDTRRRLTNREDEIKVRFRRGVQSFEDGDYGNALREFNSLYYFEGGITTEFKGALLSLIARCYFLQKDWKKAHEYANRILKLSNESGYKPSKNDLRMILMLEKMRDGDLSFEGNFPFFSNDSDVNE
ncbi:MAG: hypothetical protein ACFFAU_17605 [Candidatus Hodarchaeota archaeon]